MNDDPCPDSPAAPGPERQAYEEEAEIREKLQRDGVRFEDFIGEIEQRVRASRQPAVP
jgi:hypothetical protein